MTHIYIIKKYLSKHQIIYKSLFFGNPWSLSHTQTDQGPTHRSFHILDENLPFSINQWESKTLYVQFHNLSVMKTAIMLRKQAIVEGLARFLHKNIKKPIKIGHKLLMWTRKVQWVSPRSVNIFETDRGFLTMRHVQEKLHYVHFAYLSSLSFIPSTYNDPCWQVVPVVITEFSEYIGSYFHFRLLSHVHSV